MQENIGPAFFWKKEFMKCAQKCLRGVKDVLNYAVYCEFTAINLKTGKNNFFLKNSIKFSFCAKHHLLIPSI